jgi:AraC-like DNA-binding protein
MAGPTTADPYAELQDKYRRMAADLERFRSQTRPVALDLPRDIEEILGSIHGALFDPSLNVSSVKARCGIRNNNISTRFRRLLGVGIREYIEDLRMRAADRLLRDGGLEVYLVAMAVGYDHHETFHRAFQRRFGRTPSEHRLAGAAGEGAVPPPLET